MTIPDDDARLNPTGFDPDFSSPAQWAAMYRAAGLQIVPCKDKRPDLHKWAELQNELAPAFTFERWYGPNGEHATNANMGIITGPCSKNLIVVDLDTHKTPEAETWWQAVIHEENAGLEPETCEQRTGGGGRQKLFLAPDGVYVPTCRTDKGVDIRGTGGFAVVPPTLHQSGNNYVWLPGAAPWERDIAEAPPWLLEAIASLADAHGGDTGPKKRTASPADDFTAFGSRQDGREEEMYRTVWRAVLELYRSSPIKPTNLISSAACQEAYALYESRVVTRDGAAATKAAGLENEGRGITAFQRKWAREMRLWGSPKMAREAGKPDPGPYSPQGPQGPQSGPATGPKSPHLTPQPIAVRSAFPIDRSVSPVRNWVVPGLLLRGSVTVLVAPPGSGKSLFTLQMAIAVAAGVSWGGFTPRTRQRVLIINAEDDFDEMCRRLVVAAAEMGVSQADLVGWLDLAEAPETIVIAKIDGRSKAVIRTPLADDLIKTIADKGYGLVVADPFAETFVGDENSNSEVKWAGVLWREVARKAGVALWLVHHTKKYASAMAGDADASRGGGAMIGIARVLVTLFTMTEDEALAMDIDLDGRTDFVRLDDGKANYSRKGNVKWFEKATREVGNATGFLPSDEVGVLIAWKPPDALEGITVADLNKALDVIDLGILDENGKPSGQFWSPEQNAKTRWVGTLLMRLLDCPKKAAANLVGQWLKSGVIKTFDYHDPRVRKIRSGVKSVPGNRPGLTSFDD
jgi:hypothetical protein